MLEKLIGRTGIGRFTQSRIHLRAILSIIYVIRECRNIPALPAKSAFQSRKILVKTPFLGYFIHEILKNRVRPPCSDDFHLPCKTQKTHSFMRSGYH